MNEPQPGKSGSESTLPQRRMVLLVEYDGRSYQGLQAQKNGVPTVQGTIEQAARQLGSTEVGFQAAGRTDAGVHALGQVIALNLPTRLETRRAPFSLNAVLPHDIRIRKAVECPPQFHPRFDAIRRSYLYRLNAGVPVDPLLRHMVTYSHRTLDPSLVIQATSAFQGHWELSAWRSSDCQATRTLLNIDLAEATSPDLSTGRYHWEFRFSARSFLHHQVRFMVGAVVAVGSGRLGLDDLRRALEGGYRPDVVKLEAATGLCLVSVGYPEEKDPFRS
ncbi:MAG: tRNA pseudouridine(38-40) synthase TruA [Candidatus Sumerlaeia bacterium]|nr:tRNA pseudouridine(38-40) synthase TruA [Candidatus Sumerlaeia bacterium]